MTDADLVAGRITEGATFSGLDPLDRGAAQAALTEAGIDAQGVIAVVDAAMEEAIRVVSVERGVDPRGLALVAFGGAGPLHACALADALEMPAVIVPARAGVLSAVGILRAPQQVDVVHSVADPLDHVAVDELRAELEGQAALTLVGQLGAGRHAVWSAGGGSSVRFTDDAGNDLHFESSTAEDCRYLGQSHELSVASRHDFHAEHQRRNGYSRPDHPVEVVAVRSRAWLASPVALGGLPDLVRRGGTGPVVLAEDDCTVWVPEGWVAEPGVGGALVLTRGTP